MIQTSAPAKAQLPEFLHSHCGKIKSIKLNAPHTPSCLSSGLGTLPPSRSSCFATFALLPDLVAICDICLICSVSLLSLPAILSPNPATDH